MSAPEFAAALQRSAGGVLPTQALALYRTAAEQGGQGGDKLRVAQGGGKFSTESRGTRSKEWNGVFVCHGFARARVGKFVGMSMFFAVDLYQLLQSTFLEERSRGQHDQCVRVIE